jgi:signal transduction histidine kinase
VLTLGLSDTARTYRADELVVMEDLARRLALAIDDALLYEEMQAALREATDALNVRDQFLSVASHDLRTPLGALNGQLRLALQRVEAGEPHRAVEFVSRAAVQARRLTDLVNDLFDVARLQAGVFVVRRAPMDLVATLTAVVEMECAAHPDRRIEFVCPAAIEVHGDSARLEQVFLNLVSNAIAYSPPETPIRIVVNVTAASVQVQVHDHGPGIAPEVQARIFEAYQRGDRTGASPSGLGLGLHIAREIVRLHDGTIALRSAPGRGSVFCVDLPLIGSTAAPVAAAAPGGYHAG